MREIIPTVQTTAVGGASPQDKVLVQVRFDEAIDRFVLRFSPSEFVAGGRQQMNGSTAAGKTAKGFPHVSEVALGSIRFTPAGQDHVSDPPDGTTARVIVPATANTWTAGLDWKALAAEEIPTDQLAVRIEGLALNERTALAFSVFGAVREQTGISARTADGGRLVGNQGYPKYGISATETPVASLVGVFLGQPDIADPSPETGFRSASVPAIADETIAPGVAGRYS